MGWKSAKFLSGKTERPVTEKEGEVGERDYDKKRERHGKQESYIAVNVVFSGCSAVLVYQVLC